MEASASVPGTASITVHLSIPVIEDPQWVPVWQDLTVVVILAVIALALRGLVSGI